MGAPTRYENLTHGTVDISTMVWQDGARVIHGVGGPSNSVTGKGKAGPGSLYIRDDVVGIWTNTGTKLRPVWFFLHGVPD